MSSAESIFCRRIFEVHSGADSVNFLAGYVSSTLQILREDIYVLTRVEPRINFVSNWDGVFLSYRIILPIRKKTLREVAHAEAEEDVALRRFGGAEYAFTRILSWFPYKKEGMIPCP